MNKIEGTLLYVQLQKPVKGYVKAGQDPKPDEWKAAVAVVDEDTVDEFEEYVSSIGAKVSLKKVKIADFTEKYKCAVPEGANKYVWVMTFRKSTELGKTGRPVPDQYKPRVYQYKGKTLVDITQTVLPANGSKGVISLEKFERTDGTSNLYLKNVLVKELIEYVKAEGTNYEPGSEFDDAPDGDEEVQKETPKVVEKVKEAPKKAKKPTKVEEEEDETDSPF